MIVSGDPVSEVSLPVLSFTLLRFEFREDRKESHLLPHLLLLLPFFAPLSPRPVSIGSLGQTGTNRAMFARLTSGTASGACQQATHHIHRRRWKHTLFSLLLSWTLPSKIGQWHPLRPGNYSSNLSQQRSKPRSQMLWPSLNQVTWKKEASNNSPGRSSSTVWDENLFNRDYETAFNHGSAL